MMCFDFDTVAVMLSLLILGLTIYRKTKEGQLTVTWQHNSKLQF